MPFADTCQLEHLMNIGHTLVAASLTACSTDRALLDRLVTYLASTQRT